MNNISTLNPIELACQCSGSKPAAKIKWKKTQQSNNNNDNVDDNHNVQWLDAFSQIISQDGLTTTSFLSFVPSIDDNGKNITCIGFNPKISIEKYSIENSWPINITCMYSIYDFFTIQIKLFFVLFFVFHFISKQIHQYYH